MKRIGLFLVMFVIATCSLAFEGIIHCTKTENGVTTSFDFYVKENRIAVIYKEGVSEYRLLLDRSAQELRLCLDVPEFKNKGYYVYNSANMRKNSKIEILKQMRSDALVIDGETCEGYTVVTDKGTAIAYFGSDEVNLTGFSAFLNDPVYELLDALDSKLLPRKLVVSKVSGAYTIDLSADAQPMDDALFEVPSGYVLFEVTPEGISE